MVCDSGNDCVVPCHGGCGLDAELVGSLLRVLGALYRVSGLRGPGGVLEFFDVVCLVAEDSGGVLDLVEGVAAALGVDAARVGVRDLQVLESGWCEVRRALIGLGLDS